jgi:hypothetical protein
MADSASSLARSVLDIPAIARTRRNHGLEHATLHILAQRHPHTALAGHSDANGFWVLGDVSIEAIQGAVDEALGRLQAGESRLAIHPNCGTNFATAGVLAGLAAGAAMLGGKSTRDRIERLPLAALLATLALIIAQPLGALVQERVTTSGNPGELRVKEIVVSRRGRWRAHRIVTQS